MSELVEHSLRAAPVGSGKAGGQLMTLLIDGESVRAFALQHRLYALLHRRHVGAATSNRFIFMRRPLLGGYTPTDVRWQDLKDANLRVGMFTATVTLTFNANLSDTSTDEGDLRVLRVSGLQRTAGQALYRICQTEEQAWREKRRVRSIEEMKAASGGIQIAAGVFPGTDISPTLIEPPMASTGDDPVQRLSKARRLLDEGLINDSEFEAVKAKIVSGL